MNALRRLVARHHRVFAILALFVLATRLLVPADFMPVAGGGALVVCSGTMPVATTAHHHGDKHPMPAGEQPCGFAAASTPLLDAVEPVRAAARIVAAEIVPQSRMVVASPRLPLYRPPARGPPVAPDL